MKKFVIVLLICLLSLSFFFSCSKKEDNKSDVTTKEVTTKEVEYKDKVTIVNSILLQKLDPQNNNTSINGQFYQLTHNTLIDCDYDSGSFLPELAKSWDVSDDGLLYTFYLRDDVSFYDGTKFTSKDVKYTFDRAYSTSSQKSKLVFMTECKILDDYTIQFTLSSPDAEFLDNLCSPNLSIICESSGEGKDDWGFQNGTGAYHLTEWLPNNYAILMRNDNYWGEKPVTKEIYYQLIGEASARTIALETGDADICLDISPVDAAGVEGYGCSLVEFPSSKLVYIALNVSYVDAFKKSDVRKAFNYATDQNTIITLLREGHAATTNGVIPSSVKFSPESKTTGYEYNPEKAKELLAKAGYPEGITVSLWYDENTYPGIFECLQSMWAKSGITLTLGTSDNSILSTHVKAKEYDITIAKWSFSTIAYSLNSLWTSGSGSNRTVTADPVLDEMLVKAQGEINEEKRSAMYEEIGTYLSNLGSQIPMYVDNVINGVRKGVEGVKFYSNERYDFNNVKVRK